MTFTTLIHVHFIAYHRNGIDGAPFHAIVFDHSGPEASRKLAVVFDQLRHIAVLDIAKLSLGNVTFGENSWRGDEFEPALRAAVVRHKRHLIRLRNSTSNKGE